MSKKNKKKKTTGFELTASWFEALCTANCATRNNGSILFTNLQESAWIVSAWHFAERQFAKMTVDWNDNPSKNFIF